MLSTAHWSHQVEERVHGSGVSRQLQGSAQLLHSRNKLGQRSFWLQGGCVWAQLFSLGQLFVIPWTIAHHVPLSMGLSRQEYWSGLPFPLPGDLPDSWMKPWSPVSPALSGGFFTTEPPGKPVSEHTYIYFLALAAERAKEQWYSSINEQIKCTYLGFYMAFSNTWI